MSTEHFVYDVSSAEPLDSNVDAPDEPLGVAPERNKPRSRLWRFVPRTLTARLVVGVVALVLVVVASAGAATYEALRPFLTQRLDQQLNTIADGNIAVVQRCLNTVEETPSGYVCSIGGQFGFRSPQPSWIQLLDPSGTPRLNGLGPGVSDLELLNVPAGKASELLADPSRIVSVNVNGASLHVTARPIPRTTLIVVSGLSTEQEVSTLHQLLLAELIIGGSAVVLALLVTAAGVRFSLKPLHRVTSTARDVTAELSPEGAGLDRRVPLTEADAGTEVGQLAESVNTLLGAVETQFAARVASEQRMRQFLADASHELRTPLTSIRGYAELSRMRRDFGEATDEETMDRIESEGTRMSRLVEDLLTLARGDQGAATERAQVDVGELVADAVEGAHAAYPQRQIDVVAPAGLQVMGDHDQLLRVIRNLVTNACVHTAPNGPIRASAGRSGEWIVLQVADSGPGLPPEQAAHVFERFWRADSSRARSSGGSGLGLAIVESIVAAHGGTLRFDSDVREGSTVTI